MVVLYLKKSRPTTVVKNKKLMERLYKFFCKWKKCVLDENVNFIIPCNFNIERENKSKLVIFYDSRRKWVVLVRILICF